MSYQVLGLQALLPTATGTEQVTVFHAHALFKKPVMAPPIGIEPISWDSKSRILSIELRRNIIPFIPYSKMVVPVGVEPTTVRL